MIFPPSAEEYLERHGKTSMAKQEHRARKQLNDIERILGRISGTSVLDIGCGLAVVDALLVSERNVKSVYLIDADQPCECHGEYRENSIPWNDVQTGIDMVRANAPLDCNIYREFPDKPVSLIMSLKSCGLHYPVSVYAEKISKLLLPKGFLIIDLHKPTEASTELTDLGFRLIATLGEYGVGKVLLPFVRTIWTGISS